VGRFLAATKLPTTHHWTERRRRGLIALRFLSRGAISLGFICVCLLLATPARAQNSRFGSRAGSNFSATPSPYGKISKRPYRRRQKPVRQPFAMSDSQSSDSKLDFRFDADDITQASLGESHELLNNGSGQHYVDHHVKTGNIDQDWYDNLDGIDQSEVDQASFEQVVSCDCGDDYCNGGCVEPSCGYDEECEPGCGCDDYAEPSCGLFEGDCTTYDSYGSVYGSLKGRRAATWSVGFEWSFVKPRFSENTAFTTMTGDGANNSTFTDTEFDYDLKLTPRVWIEAARSDNWTWRLGYWQFDHAPGTASASPNANGFGEITHPSFGDVDISTTIPTDTFTVSSRLNAYTIDLEALKQARLSGWQLGVGGGVRYASVEQNYLAQLRNTGNVLRGQIDFSQQLEGFGPTLFLSARRPLTQSIKLVCSARGSLLFGDGTSRMVAGEDLDLANPFTTTRLTNRDDLLPIGEARLGLEWLTPRKRRGWQWMLSTAMEGQFWGNAGNAASETADLGFFGFNVGAGFLR